MLVMQRLLGGTEWKVVEARLVQSRLRTGFKSKDMISIEY